MATYPIFFSVASQDIALAERIFEQYADGHFYLYSKNGKQAAWFWEEIEREQLPFAKAFVIFWSKNYVRNEGTLRELMLATDFFRERRLSDCVIIRCDDTPLLDSEITGELSPEERSAIDAVKVFLRHKRTDPLKQLYPEALRIVDELVIRVEGNDIPFQRRPEEQEELRDCAKLDRMRYRPTLWVSGFNGYGRKTLVRELFRELDPNVMAVEVDIDETTLPEQIILRLESEYRGLDRDALVQEAKRIAGGGSADVVKTIEQLSTNGRFALVRQSRLYEDSVKLPEWIVEVVGELQPGRFPKLVLVAQLPPSDDEVVALAEKLAAFRVPPMRGDTATEFAWAIIGALGGREEDWTDERVGKIVHASDGTPELIITIVRHALRLADPAKLNDIIGRETQRFSDTLTHLVSWALTHLGEGDDEKRALLFLSDVSPVSREDIESFLSTGKATSAILARLMSLGLVERSPDGLFRISPLLSNRLQSTLTDEELVTQHGTAMMAFARQPLDIPDGQHGYVHIEAKIKSGLLAGQGQPAASVRDFVSAAHYLQVGIRLYNTSRYREAADLLKLAFDSRSSFGLTAQIETCRFYGLALIRRGNFDELDNVINVLRSRHQGRSIANFLEAERRRINHDYNGALPFYRRAQQDAEANREKDREERIIRPYIDSILRSRHPDHQLAKRLADRGVVLKKTVYSLWARARVYLHIWYHSGLDEESSEAKQYFEVLEKLESDPGGRSFHAQVRSEEAELWGQWDEAIDWMQEAFDYSQRFDDRLKLWGVKYRSSDKNIRMELIGEIEAFCGAKSNRAFVVNYAVSIGRRYAQALKANGELRLFRLAQLGLPLKQPEVRRIFRGVEHEGRRRG